MWPEGEHESATLVILNPPREVVLKLAFIHNSSERRETL